MQAKKVRGGTRSSFSGLKSAATLAYPLRWPSSDLLCSHRPGSYLLVLAPNWCLWTLCFNSHTNPLPTFVCVIVVLLFFFFSSQIFLNIVKLLLGSAGFWHRAWNAMGWTVVCASRVGARLYVGAGYCVQLYLARKAWVFLVFSPFLWGLLNTLFSHVFPSVFLQFNPTQSRGLRKAFSQSLGKSTGAAKCGSWACTH